MLLRMRGSAALWGRDTCRAGIDTSGSARFFHGHVTP